MKEVLIIVAVAMVFAAQLISAEKTDLEKEIYVESSVTNFALNVKVSAPADGKTRVFEVTAPPAGPCTLLCFVDRQFWTRSVIDLPGKYSLNVRGLAPGTHRVTIQVVDRNGRVGSSSHSIVKDK